MRTLTKIIILLCLMQTIIFAQDRDSEQIRQDIIALGRKIEQLRVLAERYKNQQALNILDDSKKDYTDALVALAEWDRDNRRVGQLVIARTKFQSANKKADFAARLVLFKPAAQLKNELERLIQQAERSLHGQSNADLTYFLNKARAFHRQAVNAFAQNRYLKGHEYIRIATYFAEKAINLAKSYDSSEDNPDRFEKQKNNIQILLNQTSFNSSDETVLRDLYDSASDYINRAIKAHSQGNLKRAYTLLQVAERLVYRIIDITENRGVSIADQAENNYQSLARYLAIIGNDVGDSKSALRLLKKAVTLHTQAGNHIRAGQYVKANSKLKLAQNMALRAFKKSSDNTNQWDKQDVEQRIRQVERLIKMQREKITDKNLEYLVYLNKQAEDYLKKAQNALDANQDIKANYYINLSLRILNRNENLSQAAKEKNISIEDLSSNISQIELILQRLNANNDLEQHEKIKVSILTDMFLRAKSEFDAQKYTSAQAIISIIQNQLSSLIKN